MDLLNYFLGSLLSLNYILLHYTSLLLQITITQRCSFINIIFFRLDIPLHNFLLLLQTSIYSDLILHLISSLDTSSDNLIRMFFQIVVDIPFNRFLITPDHKYLGRNDPFLLQIVSTIQIIRITLQYHFLFWLYLLHQTVLNIFRLIQKVQIILQRRTTDMIVHIDHFELILLVDLGYHLHSLLSSPSNNTVYLLMHNQFLLFDLIDQILDRVGWLVHNQFLC